MSEAEIKVTLTKEHHDFLKLALKYDKRNTGYRGRILTKSYEPLGLCQHDRLEPSAELRDIGRFEELDNFPVIVTFFRVERATMLWHRCPLWDASIGLTPVKTPAIDLLHTFYLGPLQVWVRDAFWGLIDADVFNLKEGTEKVTAENTIALINDQLFDFYKDNDRKGP